MAQVLSKDDREKVYHDMTLYISRSIHQSSFAAGFGPRCKVSSSFGFGCLYSNYQNFLLREHPKSSHPAG